MKARVGLGLAVEAVTVDLVLDAAATPATVPVLPSIPAASALRGETLSLLEIMGEEVDPGALEELGTGGTS